MLSLWLWDDTRPLPGVVAFQLICDNPACPDWLDIYFSIEGYVTARSDATAKGWKVSDDGGPDLCPRCSGKKIPK